MGHATGRARGRQLGLDPAPEPCQLRIVAGVHRRLELAGVGQQRPVFDLGEAGHVLGVVRSIRLEQEQVVGAVMGDGLVWEELRVPGRNDPVCGQPAGVAVIGVQAVPFPRIMAEDHVRFGPADPQRHLGPLLHAGGQLAVRPAEEADLAERSQHRRRIPLFPLPGGDQLGHIGIGIPRPLRAVGADQHADLAAGGGPLCQGRPAAEIDVVGMGPDGQRPGRCRQVGGELGHRHRCRGQWILRFAHRSTPRSVGWRSGSSARSVGVSTSQPRERSAITRSARPRRSASARWAAAESGP